MRSKPTYWDKVKKQLIPKFATAKLLDICELGWEGCLANKQGYVPKQFQNFAHSLRRRKIDVYKKHEPKIYDQKMREVARTCVSCHAKLDALPHEETYDIVRDIIKNRKRKV